MYRKFDVHLHIDDVLQQAQNPVLQNSAGLHEEHILLDKGMRYKYLLQI